MPIKGFLPPPKFAQLGTIRLGKKAVTSGKEHPDDLDHFRVPQEVAEALHPVRQPDGNMKLQPYGDEPKELEIMLPTSDFDLFCPMELQRWDSAERLLCHGDGETAKRWNDDKGKEDIIECPYDTCEFFGKERGEGCDEVGTLNVILPFVNTLGIYVINTHSRHGLRNIRDEFAAALAGVVNVCGNPDMIRAVTFRLTRELKTVHYIKDKVRKPSQKYILHLRPQPLTMPQARQLAAQFGTNQGAPMLSTGETILVPGTLPQLPPAMALPEPTPPQCPQDLVPGASPVGPDLAQKNKFAGLRTTLQAICRNMVDLRPDMTGALKERWSSFETTVARSVNKDAAKFDDLEGETEAPEALMLAEKMVVNWQEELEAERDAQAAVKGGGDEAAAEVEPEPEPEPEPSVDTRVKHGDPTESAPATRRTRSKSNGNSADRDLGI
jgi:hypothetical protein